MTDEQLMQQVGVVIAIFAGATLLERVEAALVARHPFLWRDPRRRRQRAEELIAQARAAAEAPSCAK